ncbi:DUF2264 domain-containing protein [Clostridium sp. YIM B02515]|uniref:DUF2264 domain-containing protein n=1 Tax=Clostridium rhizosphaerae TaxID=2803861 RepID=A0ABS1TCU1_9CLOT|nr:DUF2264 domain-containing protein [Clostridium rhizosphaerae]MBL4937153.1 DUF2264 domain-containing protein [Clostridium rhizosphaerae]
MAFKILDPNYEKSPYSGMTKKHWLDASKFLLEGIFRHIPNMDAPVLVPRQEFSISYPNNNTNEWKKYAQKFEGLARSFLLAAPLLHNEPSAKVCGYSLKEYYKKQILLSVTSGTPNYLLSVPELESMAKSGETAFQHTCECASLVIGFEMCKKVIWDTYTDEEKDAIAAYLSSFGHSRTSSHNWRLFNMLILGFLHQEGYDIDKDIMRDHGQTIISYYAGDGWYRDGHSFDYYTPWAFHVYGPLWNQWYGYENEPYIAEKIEQYSNSLVESYPNMFDKRAQVTMWGRSCIYRSAATAPLAANFLLRNHKANPGLARRINSGALLQFITKEEVFYEGVPCLGFYGPFEAMLQDYSCAESPFWLANSFVCLCLEDNHPYWQDQENNGIWENLEKTKSKTTVLNGPGIVIDNHGANGITEFRTGKTMFSRKSAYIRNYLRLSFNSEFPWEDFDYAGAEAMQYSLKYFNTEEAIVPNIILYGGEKEGVLYRKEYFDFESSFQGKPSICIADFPVDYGMIRVDKMRIHDKPFMLSLGAYGFPKDDKVIIEERNYFGAKAIVIKGKEKQIAMCIYAGFDDIRVKERVGVNAIAKESYLIYGEVNCDKYYEYKPYVMISAILTKNDLSSWTEEELFPIKAFKFEDRERCGGYGKVYLKMQDGRNITVDYEELEGRLSI